MKKIFLLLSLTLFFVQTSFAKGISENNIGIYLNGGAPMHGGMGGGLAYNPNDWIRVLGELNYETSETDRALERFTTNFVAALFWLIFLGETEFQDIYDFFYSDDPNYQEQNVMSTSLGVEFIYPTGSEWAPSLGVMASRYSQENNINNLTQKTGSYMNYKLGLDYQSKEGLHFNVGVAYAPQLPEIIKHSGYFRLGFFF